MSILVLQFLLCISICLFLLRNDFQISELKDMVSLILQSLFPVFSFVFVLNVVLVSERQRVFKEKVSLTNLYIEGNFVAEKNYKN